MPLCWSGAGTGPGDAVLAQELPALLSLPSRAGKDTGRQKGLSQVLLVRDRTPSVGSTGCLGAEGGTGLVQHPHNAQRGKGQGRLASRRIRPDTAPASQSSCLGQSQVWEIGRESPQSWDSCHPRGLWWWDAHMAAPGVTWRIPPVALPGELALCGFPGGRVPQGGRGKGWEKRQKPFPIPSVSPG